jgi:hypothetical protein
LSYFFSYAVANGPEFGTAINFMGAGFWIAFLANVGLVVQATMPRPATKKPQATGDNA